MPLQHEWTAVFVRAELFVQSSHEASNVGAPNGGMIGGLCELTSDVTELDLVLFALRGRVVVVRPFPKQQVERHLRAPPNRFGNSQIQKVRCPPFADAQADRFVWVGSRSCSGLAANLCSRPKGDIESVRLRAELRRCSLWVSACSGVDVATSVRNRLIIQFEVSEGDSFDALIAIEDTLIQAFSQNNYAVVDGHDFGQSRFNIFIYPRGSWGPVIERVQAFLKLKGWLSQAVIAKELKSGALQVIWPQGHSTPFEL